MNKKIFVLEKKGESYQVIDKVKYKKEEQLANYKKHIIPIPPKNTDAMFTDKDGIMFFDLANKQYITFNKVDLGLSTKFLDKLFAQNLIGQLAKAVKRASDGEKTNYDFIKTAVICGVCALGGYLIGIGGF